VGTEGRGESTRPLGILVGWLAVKGVGWPMGGFARYDRPTAHFT